MDNSSNRPIPSVAPRPWPYSMDEKYTRIHCSKANQFSSELDTFDDTLAVSDSLFQAQNAPYTPAADPHHNAIPLDPKFLPPNCYHTATYSIHCSYPIGNDENHSADKQSMRYSSSTAPKDCWYCSKPVANTLNCHTRYKKTDAATLWPNPILFPCSILL